MTLFIRRRQRRGRCARCHEMTDAPHSVVYYRNVKARRASDVCERCASTYDFGWLLDSDRVMADRATPSVQAGLLTALAGRLNLLL